MGAKKKLAALLVVATTGVTAALFFRKDGAVEQVQSGGTDERQLSESIPRRVATPNRSDCAADCEGQGAPSTGRTHVRPAPTAATHARRDDPPELPAGYRQTLSRASAISEQPADPDDDELGDVETSASGSDRTHVIVDGDTLSKLAQQYLGNVERAAEIFALNRDVLSHPELLPIGKSLKIPDRTVSGTLIAPLAPADSDPRLVPIPQQSLRRADP